MFVLLKQPTGLFETLNTQNNNNKSDCLYGKEQNILFQNVLCKKQKSEKL